MAMGAVTVKDAFSFPLHLPVAGCCLLIVFLDCCFSSLPLR